MVDAVISYLPVIFVALAALGCGAIIGIEREISQKPAGLRTTMLVVLGAALFTFISPLIADINTTRIAANVVVGIGFIGAGTIMRNDRGVQGITTAATLWVAAALGMMIGAQLFVEAFIVTVLVVLVLRMLVVVDTYFEKKLQRRQ